MKGGRLEIHAAEGRQGRQPTRRAKDGPRYGLKIKAERSSKLEMRKELGIKENGDYKI